MKRSQRYSNTFVMLAITYYYYVKVIKFINIWLNIINQVQEKAICGSNKKDAQFLRYHIWPLGKLKITFMFKNQLLFLFII